MNVEPPLTRPETYDHFEDVRIFVDEITRIQTRQLSLFACISRALWVDSTQRKFEKEMSKRKPKNGRLTKNERHRLIEVANLAKFNAYAPYSRFRVGAALLSEDFTFFAGCNVENSSYGLTICAERNAVFKAVCAGKTSFSAIAIVTDDKDFVTPCGACRQVLAEFAPTIQLILTNGKGEVKVTSLEKIFPHPPDLKKLSRSSKK